MAKKNRHLFVRRHRHLAPLVVLFKAFVTIWIVIIFGSLGYHVIESEFTRLLKRRHDMKCIEQMRDHYVVCGYGRIGSFICREFDRRGVPFVVVERKKEVGEAIRDAGFLLSPGDATREEVLEGAGIDKARGLVSVLESDAANLHTVLTGRQLNSKLHITARAGERSAQTKLKLVGADRVINPYVLGGMRMVLGVLKPDVLSFLDMVVDCKERAIELEEIRISDKSGYCDRPLSETAIARDRKLIVLSVKKHDGRHVFNPEPDTVLEAEDTVIAIGDREVLAGLA